MYQAKQSGKARYAHFEEAMSAGALGAEQQPPSSPRAGRVRGPLPAQGVARYR
jgi:hypothetical protein